MNWSFLDNNTIVEKNTGYMIVLIGGTWFSPKEIKPVAPKAMPFLQQAQLMRYGLEYVSELCAANSVSANEYA